MRALLTKYTMERLEKELKNVQGKNIMVDDVWLYRVKSFKLEYLPIDEDFPEELRDGSEENTIRITFEFMDGRAAIGFCPEREVCEVWNETEELLIFRIQSTKKYIKQEMDRLDFMKNEYKQYMNA